MIPCKNCGEEIQVHRHTGGHVDWFHAYGAWFACGMGRQSTYAEPIGAGDPLLIEALYGDF